MNRRPTSADLRAPVPAAGKRRPYVRPMAGWWRKNPYFVEYMIHEGTALFVGAYALLLLISLVKLSQGEAAWTAWVACLRSPVGIGFHVLTLVAMSYHSWTWFHIMPRTLPPLRLGAKRVPGATITNVALVIAGLASMALLVISLGAFR